MNIFLNSKSFFSVDWVLCLAAHAPWLLTERVVSRLVQVWQTALTPPHLLLLTLFSPATRHLFTTSAKPLDSWQKVSTVQSCSSRGLQRDVVYLGRPIAPFYSTWAQMRGEGGVAVSQPMSTAVIWRSNSIFNLCDHPFPVLWPSFYRFNIPTSPRPRPQTLDSSNDVHGKHDSVCRVPHFTCSFSPDLSLPSRENTVKTPNFKIGKPCCSSLHLFVHHWPDFSLDLDNWDEDSTTLASLSLSEVLQIRIRKDPKLLAGFDPEPDLKPDPK